MAAPERTPDGRSGDVEEDEDEADSDEADEDEADAEGADAEEAEAEEANADRAAAAEAAAHEDALEEADGSPAREEAAAPGPPPEEHIGGGDGAPGAPAAKRKKKKKKPSATDVARKRVCQKLKEERKAAKRARRREAARAGSRRGAQVDIEAFLEKTRQRLEAKAVEAEEEAAQAAADAARAAVEAAADVAGGTEQARKRLLARTAMAKRALSAQEAAIAAKAAAKAACIDLEEFQKKTHARVMQRLWDKLPQARDGCVGEPGVDGDSCARALFTRRRIAIVGAGPVGLWAAVLLADKYSKLGDGCRVRRPDAPEVVILEGRPEDAHGTRTDIRIALSSPTQSLLNQRTGSRSFSSGMPLAEIEAALLRRWRRLCPRDAVAFSRGVGDPGALTSLEGFDCVLWAGGRRSLEAGLRRRLGCGVLPGDSERVLVFQVDELSAGDAWQLVSLDLTGVVRQAARCSTLRVMVRPGLGGACACWVWLFGLPRMEEDPGRPHAAETPAGPSRHETMGEALCAALGGGAPGADAEALRAAADALQQRVRPAAVSARWVDAAFWSSDRVVCEVPGPDADAPGLARPLVLIGDAACGKPFYTGTTLNRHFWDVAALVDEVEWPFDGVPLTPGTFDAHERRYQAEIRRVAEFRRRGRCDAQRPAHPLRPAACAGPPPPRDTPPRVPTRALSLPALVAC